MSRVVVIGATGHIGTYLVPRLVRGGHEVIAMSRGTARAVPREPAVERGHPGARWTGTRRTRPGTFGARVAALRPDAVIDLVCFTPAAAQQLVDALRPARPLLLHCGTIWVHGPALRVPVTEDEPRTAYGEYGTGKAAIEALLHRRRGRRGSRRWCCTRGTSAGPAGRSSPRPATWTRPCGRRWPPASRWRCPTTAWACCTTCTPTTWRRRSSGRCPGPPRSGPASMWWPRRR